MEPLVKLRTKFLESCLKICNPEKSLVNNMTNPLKLQEQKAL